MFKIRSESVTIFRFLAFSVVLNVADWSSVLTSWLQKWLPQFYLCFIEKILTHSIIDLFNASTYSYLLELDHIPLVKWLHLCIICKAMVTYSVVFRYPWSTSKMKWSCGKVSYSVWRHISPLTLGDSTACSAFSLWSSTVERVNSYCLPPLIYQWITARSRWLHNLRDVKTSQERSLLSLEQAVVPDRCLDKLFVFFLARSYYTIKKTRKLSFIPA